MQRYVKASLSMLRFASRDNFRAAAGWGFPHHGNREAAADEVGLDHHHDDNSAAAGLVKKMLEEVYYA